MTDRDAPEAEPDAPRVRAASESAWRGRIEAGFEAWGRIVVRNRWVALAVSVLATGWLMSHLPQLEIDNSTESFLTTDAPNVVLYNDFRDQFGRDDKIVIAVGGGDVRAVEGGGGAQPRVLAEQREVLPLELAHALLQAGDVGHVRPPAVQ